MSEVITRNDILSIIKSMQAPYREYKNIQCGTFLGLDIGEIIVEIIDIGIHREYPDNIIRVNPIYDEIIKTHNLKCPAYVLKRKVNYVINRSYNYINENNLDKFRGATKQLAKFIYSERPKLKKLMCYAKSIELSKDTAYW